MEARTRCFKLAIEITSYFPKLGFNHYIITCTLQYVHPILYARDKRIPSNCMEGRLQTTEWTSNYLVEDTISNPMNRAPTHQYLK